MLAAEQRAEIVVFYALGDADGPLAHEVKIGIRKWRTYQSDIVYRMRAYRSREIAHRVEVYVRGDAAALRLKTAVFARLNEDGYGLGRPDWFRVGANLGEVIRAVAADERISLFSEDEAREIEQRELEKLMEKFL